MLFPYI